MISTMVTYLLPIFRQTVSQIPVCTLKTCVKSAFLADVYIDIHVILQDIECIVCIGFRRVALFIKVIVTIVVLVTIGQV